MGHNRTGSKRKFIATQAHEARKISNNPTSHRKELEKEAQTGPKADRRRELITISVDTNAIEIYEHSREVRGTRSSFLGKMDVPSAKLIKKERAEINRILREGRVVPDTTEMQRITDGDRKQLHANKPDPGKTRTHFQKHPTSHSCARKKQKIRTGQLLATELNRNEKAPRAQKPGTRWLRRRVKGAVLLLEATIQQIIFISILL